MLRHGGWPLANNGTPSPMILYTKDQNGGGWLATHFTHLGSALGLKTLAGLQSQALYAHDIIV